MENKNAFEQVLKIFRDLRDAIVRAWERIKSWFKRLIANSGRRKLRLASKVLPYIEDKYLRGFYSGLFFHRVQIF